MIIKPFNWVWFLNLAIQIAVIILATGFLKDKTRDQKLSFMKWFTALAFLCWTLYKIGLWLWPEQVGGGYTFIFWDELPLYPCNTMLVLGIFACIFDSRPIMSFGFYIGIICAMLALAMPQTGFYDIPFFTVPALGFYLTHGAVIAIGVLYVTTGLIEVSYKSAFWAVVTFILIMCGVHVINIILRATVFPEASYFYTFGNPDNFLLDYIRTKIIPVDLLYMVAVALFSYPINALETFLIRLPGKIRKGKARAKS